MKNLLVGEDEMIVASRVEHTLRKAEIPRALSQFGLPRAQLLGDRARRPQLFGKPAKELTPNYQC